MPKGFKDGPPVEFPGHHGTWTPAEKSTSQTLNPINPKPYTLNLLKNPKETLKVNFVDPSLKNPKETREGKVQSSQTEERISLVRSGTLRNGNLGGVWAPRALPARCRGLSRIAIGWILVGLWSTRWFTVSSGSMQRCT